MAFCCAVFQEQGLKCWKSLFVGLFVCIVRIGSRREREVSTVTACVSWNNSHQQMALEKEQRSNQGTFFSKCRDRFFPSSLLSKITLEVWSPGFSGMGWQQLSGVKKGSVALKAYIGAEGFSSQRCNWLAGPTLVSNVFFCSWLCFEPGICDFEVGNFLLFQVDSYEKRNPFDSVAF